MNIRTVQQVIHAVAVSEGAGVTVHRTIGSPALRNLDPFLMMDFFCSDDPDDYIAGFPDHPHRGFNTFTYMLDGHMLHQDSMGNKGDLLAGGAQWMKAASGVIHSEMPQQTAGLMRGFQLWVNLPASEKMSEPEYQEFSPDSIPTVTGNGVAVRVVIGEYGGQRGPVNDPQTSVQYLDVKLESNRPFSHTLNADFTGFVYVFEGDAIMAGTRLPEHTFAVLGKGDAVEILAGDKGARMILVAGRPIKESIAQYGPFVMNTEKEIHQAFDDYRAGQLVRKKASFVTA